MADRDLTAGVLTEIAKDQTFPFFLLDVLVGPVGVFLTSAFEDIVFNSQNYSAVGLFLGFTPVKETDENRTTKLVVTLSGVSQASISLFLSVSYINRPIKIHLGFIDATDYSVIVDPFLLFDGFISAVAINDDPSVGTSTVSVEASDHWEAFGIIPGRHTNNDEQQALFPGDFGFEFVATIPQDLKWGRS